MIRLKAPEGACCVGFAGKEYAVDDGRVTVPDEAAETLRAHSYERDEPRPKPPAAGKR
jgi:hypothetical protein